jgi:SAM-dependent methyltransferase
MLAAFRDAATRNGHIWKDSVLGRPCEHSRRGPRRVSGRIVTKRTDRQFLTEVAYADGGRLTDRAALYDFQRPRIDLVGEAITALGAIEGQLVVDVGCGTGQYLPALDAAGATVIALDLSTGMLGSVTSSRWSRVAADATSLPFASGSADAVLMMHMLYHVPEPPYAVREARRMLRPGGRLLVTTAGDRHLAEMNATWLGVLDELHVRGDLQELSLVNTMFPPREARALLEANFASVTERRLTAPVVVPEPGPILRHAASTAAAHTSTRDNSEVISRMETHVASVIAREGSFRTTSDTALFVAR